MPDNPAYTPKIQPAPQYGWMGSSYGQVGPTPPVQEDINATHKAWEEDRAAAAARERAANDTAAKHYQDQISRQKAQDALAASAQSFSQGLASQRAAQEQKAAEQLYGLKASEEQRKQQAFGRSGELFNRFESMMPSSAIFGGGGGSSSFTQMMPNFAAQPMSVGGGGGGIAHPAAPAPVSMPANAVAGWEKAVPDTSGAESLAFGRAKAQAGQLGQSAMEGLRANLAGRGILGSGTEGRGLVSRLQSAIQPLSDLNVAQAQGRVDLIKHAQDMAQQAALEKYRGDVTQRGQDISQLGTEYTGDISQRGQDIGLQEAMMQNILGQQELATRTAIANRQNQSQQISGLANALAGMTRY